MSTTRSTHTAEHRFDHPLAPTVAVEALDPALALLQQHQVSQISPRTISAAESRLQDALDQARRGRRLDPSLLLQQLATDLGITLDLS